MTRTEITVQSFLQQGDKRRYVSWPGLVVIGALICVAAFYWYRTRLPQSVTIAGGPEGGRYAELAAAIAEELQQRLKITVNVKTTQGSLQNLKLLATHDVDLALYQSGTQRILEASSPLRDPAVQFVSNLYPEFLIPVGRADTRIQTATTFSCSDRMSGDYALMRLLLNHVQISEDNISVREVRYTNVAEQLREKNIDVGIICCGIDAPILKNLLSTSVAELIDIPALDALAQKHTVLVRNTIPAGYFSTSPMIPAEDFPTVALHAQLLANRDASVRLVEEVTTVLTDADFQQRSGLTDLFDGSTAYAVNRPEYEMHPGAAHIFHPEFKPLLNPDFVEGTEGLRSFLVSLIAAVWLLHRWWTRRQIRRQEHRLDRYIRDLLTLERQQMEVDGDGGPDESQVLQRLLDQVTLLRQEALAEFTAHELNEDNAVGCFIQMCHALSDKVNAKLIRHSVLQGSNTVATNTE